MILADVARNGDSLHVRFAGGRGVIFRDTDAIAKAGAMSIACVPDETIVAMALESVGIDNAKTLIGKTVTLHVTVEIV